VSWYSSWAFFLLLPLIGVFVWAYIRRKNKRPTLQVSDTRLFKGMHRSWRVYGSSLPKALKAFALGLAIVALARPQQADTKVKRNVEGIDIIIALDVSDSMLIEDMRPQNRLEASKKTIKEFVTGRLSDRIGLVVFSGESYTRVPLTLDYPLLQKSLSEVTTTRSIKMGTAIGVALGNAVGRLKDSTAKSRVVIFLTDGENNSGTISPEEALEIAKGYGIKIYSIGMGRDGQAQLPYYVRGPGGRKIKQYRPIHSKVNESLLERLGTETGGRFYRATTTRSLKSIFNDTSKSQQKLPETKSNGHQ
jgi:Ca-activated chloride channel family protein